MAKLLQGKIVTIFKLLVKQSPFCVALSMLFKGSFLLTQVISIGVIISWALGSVNPILVEAVGYSSGSIVYPCVGALGFMVSSILSLFSKIFALKATFSLEEFIIKKSLENEISIIPGDLKNIVKLMIAIIDNIVPIFLLLGISLVWTYLAPYSMIVILFLFSSWIWFLRKWVGFSEKKYRKGGGRSKIDGYLTSDEHHRFYDVLTLPNYISISFIVVISITVVFVLFIAKFSVSSTFGASAYLLLVTGVAIIQTKSFVGVIQRAGAYSSSLYGICNALLDSNENV